VREFLHGDVEVGAFLGHEAREQAEDAGDLLGLLGGEFPHPVVGLDERQGLDEDGVP